MSVSSSPAAGDGRVRLALAVLAVNLLGHQTTTLLLGPLLVPIAAEFETTVAAVGLLAAVTSVPWAIAGLIGGPLSDRWGRKPMLLGGNLITGLGTLLAGFAGSYGVLLALRLFTGFGASTIGPNVTSATADLVSPARRGTALGWVLSGSSLGSVVGVPLIAYIAGLWGWRAAFWTAGAVTIAILAAELLILPVTGRRTGPGVPYLGSFRIA
ncbi:MAG TPA: MFS transporter, partial [Dehalococcoidia bacterium]|nr:MFS transporter [Dehalococcoidia bacterium]